MSRDLPDPDWPGGRYPPPAVPMPGGPVALADGRSGYAVARRARIVLLWLVCAVALATGALVLALAAPASQASGTPEPTVVVVQPGDTLWSVAAQQVPGRDPYRMIEEIQRLNGLPDHVIHPGQELLVPSR